MEGVRPCYSKSKSTHRVEPCVPIHSTLLLGMSNTTLLVILSNTFPSLHISLSLNYISLLLSTQLILLKLKTKCLSVLENMFNFDSVLVLVLGLSERFLLSLLYSTTIPSLPHPCSSTSKNSFSPSCYCPTYSYYSFCLL